MLYFFNYFQNFHSFHSDQKYYYYYYFNFDWFDHSYLPGDVRTQRRNIIVKSQVNFILVIRE